MTGTTITCVGDPASPPCARVVPSAAPRIGGPAVPPSALDRVVLAHIQRAALG